MIGIVQCVLRLLHKISLAEMGVPVQQIAQGVKVEEKTVHKWLNEKKDIKAI